MTEGRGQFKESQDALARADGMPPPGKARIIVRTPPEQREPERECAQATRTQTPTTQHLEALADSIESRSRFLRGQVRRAAHDADLLANSDTRRHSDSSPNPHSGTHQTDAAATPTTRRRAAAGSDERQRRLKCSATSSSKLVALVSPMRCLPRQAEVRIAKYSRFPRESADQLPRIGFTRDVSGLGMCLGVDHSEPIGALLRVELRTLDGESMGASIARVVWCKGARDDRQWLGLDLLCDIDKPEPETNLA